MSLLDRAAYLRQANYDNSVMVSSTRWQYVLLPASETFETPTAIVLPEGSEDEELQASWKSLEVLGVAVSPPLAGVRPCVLHLWLC